MPLNGVLPAVTDKGQNWILVTGISREFGPAFNVDVSFIRLFFNVRAVWLGALCLTGQKYKAPCLNAFFSRYWGYLFIGFWFYCPSFP